MQVKAHFKIDMIVSPNDFYLKFYMIKRLTNGRLYNIFGLERRHTQVVRDRSAKPLCIGSIPIDASFFRAVWQKRRPFLYMRGGCSFLRPPLFFSYFSWAYPRVSLFFLNRCKTLDEYSLFIDEVRTQA